MRIIEAEDELRTAVSAARAAEKRIGFVPTMGALHQGHLSLVSAAKRECDLVAVSIFINPTQFGPNEDYDKYPRTLNEDTKLLAGEDVDLVFTPARETIYPEGCSTWVEVEGLLTRTLEAAQRPEHFRGVTTVVAKLFQLVAPDVAYFGRKDFQQSVVIRRMTHDLCYPIDIQVCETIRDPDGLALSSRNQYLNEKQRQQALSLSKGLFAARAMFEHGERHGDALHVAVQAVFDEYADVSVDYIAIVDPETLEPLETVVDRCAVLIAARVGQTRLIDNLMLEN
ncbi:MAG: pantoate--beta-alanine ligase [Pirellulales bacterium]|nr:pantoate--beta-alanine ligase [Pirellulales bacterium]